MPWPQSQDYNEAIQVPGSSFADPELRDGHPIVNALGLPMPRSGNFADVYEFQGASDSRWAIKCFTREVPGLQERYEAISKHLRQASLPFTVDFTYLQQGVRIGGRWFPILKMQWVDGLLLNEFVRRNLDKPTLLEGLSQIWLRMARRLREASMAHADLQHGNVILVPGRKASSLALKLIDYDGMWVPALGHKPSGEVGHPAYQHPERVREGLYTSAADRLPVLAIACALRGISVSGTALWERYDNGDNLLFRENDLREPSRSALFKELWHLPDPVAHDLAGYLAISLALPLDRVPLVSDLIRDGKTVPLNQAQEEWVTQLLGRGEGRGARGERQIGNKERGEAGLVSSSGLPVSSPLAPPLSPLTDGSPRSGLDDRTNAPVRTRRGSLFAILLLASPLLLAAFLGFGLWLIWRNREPEADKAKSVQESAQIEGKKQVPANQTWKNSVGIELAYIPAGEFLMGSPDREPGRRADEGPVHRVKITKSFFLGIFEVTQAQYELVAGNNPSQFRQSSAHPVERVSWDEADLFCKKLSDLPEEKKAGHLYRLPTEAEWEYACRAGTSTPFHYGLSLLPHQANFHLGKTTKVGSYPPNEWGLYDMHGNVWEWCLDAARAYATSVVTDPTGSQDPSAWRARRGGSFLTGDNGCRCAIRYPGDRVNRFGDLGFRVACHQHPALHRP